MGKILQKWIVVLIVTIFSFAVYGNSYINKIRQKAESGDVEAQFALGVRYYFGKGVKKDYAEAFSWFSKAAEKEHMKAEYNLGVCFYYGKGVEKNYKKAAEWYLKAAEKGFPDAQYNLGKCFYLGEGVNKDPQQAMNWFRKAADNKFAKAQYTLGNIYYWTKLDSTTGVYWYKKAAELGHADAQFQLGKCYAIGTGVSQDEWEAKNWINKASTKGHVKAEALFSSLNSFDTKQGREEKIGEWKNEYFHMRNCSNYCPVKNLHNCSFESSRTGFRQSVPFIHYRQENRFNRKDNRSRTRGIRL